MSRGRRDLGRGTTVAVTGKETVVDAVGLARWPEEVEEGGETGLSEEAVGRENGPRGRRKPWRGWGLQAKQGERKRPALPAPPRGCEADGRPRIWWDGGQG